MEKSDNKIRPVMAMFCIDPFRGAEGGINPRCSEFCVGPDRQYHMYSQGLPSTNLHLGTEWENLAHHRQGK